MSARAVHRESASTWFGLASTLALVLVALVLPATAPAAPVPHPIADDVGAEWRVEQPFPPAPPIAGAGGSESPVSLGHIGDIEFYESSPGVYEPNRGALITSGNGGSVKPGVWFYNGAGWKELSEQCGGTDGRIAWSGPDELWTVSDTRAGQAVGNGEQRPPVADNTLCHFAPSPSEPHQMEIVGSYGSVPFLGSSYQAMHAAACLSPSDCWFGVNPLPEPQIGAFQLHWNGAQMEPQPYLPEGHQVWDMVPYESESGERQIYETTRVQADDRVEHSGPNPALRAIKSQFGGEESPFESAGLEKHFLYSSAEFTTALDYLRLSTAGGSLWAGAGAQVPGPPAGSREAGVTIVRKATATGEWQTVIGPQEGEEQESPPPGQIAFPKEVLNAIAAEPGTSSAWLALESESDALNGAQHARASVARISAEGAVSDQLELPLSEDPHGPLGTAQRIVCPAEHDCWLATSEGWLLHLATEAERNEKNVLADPRFTAVENGTAISVRPPDAGVPQEAPDTLPENDSGEATFMPNQEVIKAKKEEPAKVTVPLLSHVHARVLHHNTLVLSFHLAVKARVQLQALRHKKVIARTAMYTFHAGNRSLRLRLNPSHWPQSLKLKTHALAPLPTQTSLAPSVNSISTSFVAPARLLSTGPGF